MNPMDAEKALESSCKLARLVTPELAAASERLLLATTNDIIASVAKLKTISGIMSKNEPIVRTASPIWQICHYQTAGRQRPMIIESVENLAKAEIKLDYNGSHMPSILLPKNISGHERNGVVMQAGFARLGQPAGGLYRAAQESVPTSAYPFHCHSIDDVPPSLALDYAHKGARAYLDTTGRLWGNKFTSALHKQFGPMTDDARALCGKLISGMDPASPHSPESLVKLAGLELTPATKYAATNPHIMALPETYRKTGIEILAQNAETQFAKELPTLERYLGKNITMDHPEVGKFLKEKIAGADLWKTEKMLEDRLKPPVKLVEEIKNSDLHLFDLSLGPNFLDLI